MAQQGHAPKDQQFRVTIVALRGPRMATRSATFTVRFKGDWYPVEVLAAGARDWFDRLEAGCVVRKAQGKTHIVGAPRGTQT